MTVFGLPTSVAESRTINMDLLVAQLINGAVLGSIYVLLVLGLNLLFLVGGVVQFAYPYYVVLSMYGVWYVLGATSNNLVMAIAASIGIGVLLSVASEPLFRRASSAGALEATFIIGLGLAMVITEIIAQRLNQGLAISFPTAFTGGAPIIQAGRITVSQGQIVTVVGTAVATLAIYVILYLTKQGIAFRAIAQDPATARILGIPMRRLSLTSYGIAGVLAGASAVFLAMSLKTATPALGNSLALKILAIVLFAGLGKLLVGVIAAAGIGMLESLTLGYVSGAWSNVVVFTLIMVIIMIEPRGLYAIGRDDIE